MPRTYLVEGIVIKRINIGESDKLLTIFTRKHGKITAVGKSIRKINSKKSPHLELFNHMKAFVAQGKSLDIITEAYSLTVFPHLSSDLHRLAYAYKISEEIDSLCPEKEINTETFILLLKAFSTLDTLPLERLNAISTRFTHRLLWNLGFLAVERRLSTSEIDDYVQQIIERNLRSNKLIEKIN